MRGQLRTLEGLRLSAFRSSCCRLRRADGVTLQGEAGLRGGGEGAWMAPDALRAGRAPRRAGRSRLGVDVGCVCVEREFFDVSSAPVLAPLHASVLSPLPSSALSPRPYPSTLDSRASWAGGPTRVAVGAGGSLGASGWVGAALAESLCFPRGCSPGSSALTVYGNSGTKLPRGAGAPMGALVCVSTPSPE